MKTLYEIAEHFNVPNLTIAEYEHSAFSSPKVYFRVVEVNQSYDCGWIYCSNQIEDYYIAIVYAIIHESLTGNKTWVEAFSRL